MQPEMGIKLQKNEGKKDFSTVRGDFKGHSGITSAFRAAVYSRRLGEPPFRRMWESSIHSETKQPCQPVIVRGAVGHTVEAETIS